MPAPRLLAWFNPEAGIEGLVLGRAEHGKVTADRVLGLPGAGRLAVPVTTEGILDPLGAGRRAEVVATVGGGAAEAGARSRLARLLGKSDSSTLLRAALGGPIPGPPELVVGGPGHAGPARSPSDRGSGQGRHPGGNFTRLP